MSWIWPDYINRDLQLTREERKAIHHDAWKLWGRNRWNVAIYLALPAVFLVGVESAREVGAVIGGAVGAGGWILKLFRAGGLVALVVICFVIGGAVLQRIRFAPCVYRATRQRGHDVCTRCGYWLRGLGDDVGRCPECGAERERDSD
jgi:hypothetical protein